MAMGRGVDSYIAWGPQTVHGTKITPAIVQVPLRTGRIFTPRDYMMVRESSGVMMAKRGQMWPAPKIVDWSVPFEWVTGTLVNLPTLLNSAMGHYLKSGAGPFLRKVNFANPPVQNNAAGGGIDDTATDFYGRPLTIEHVVKSLRAYDIRDGVITSLQLIMEGGRPIRTEISGVGALFEDITAGSAVAFTDVTGTLITFEHGIGNLGGSPPTGFAVGPTNPPAASDTLNCRRCSVTINPNLRIEPFLGLGANIQYKLPDRAGDPSIEMTLSGDFEQGITGWDAVEAVTAFSAATRENARAALAVDASNIVEFLATAAAGSQPGLVVDPAIEFNGNGVLGFSHTIRFYPEAVGTDVVFNITSAT